MKKTLACRILSAFVAFSFCFNYVVPPVYAQGLPATVMNLPVPGTPVPLTPGFTPPRIIGMTIHADNPLMFDFMVDPGDSTLTDQALQDESLKLVKYFLASLTVPAEKLWVNLSPYEKDKIVPEEFGQTEMGTDLLAQDYLLKQLTASLMNPEDELGKKFWDRVYEKAQKMFGTTEIPLNTFNKIWIVPEKAVVYVNGLNTFVLESRFKVMMEEDYEALRNEMSNAESRASREELSEARDEAHGQLKSLVSGGKAKGTRDDFNSPTVAQVIREVLIPAIEVEVNEGKTFANLRQIHNSLVLATWYKQNLKESLLGQIYADKGKTGGLTVQDKETSQKIYNQYIEAFQKGVYNFIKEDYDPVTKEIIPRKYFSGGVTEAKLEVERTSPDPVVLETFAKRSKNASIVSAGVSSPGGEISYKMPFPKPSAKPASSPITVVVPSNKDVSFLLISMRKEITINLALSRIYVTRPFPSHPSLDNIYTTGFDDEEKKKLKSGEIHYFDRVGRRIDSLVGQENYILVAWDRDMLRITNRTEGDVFVRAASSPVEEPIEEITYDKAEELRKESVMAHYPKPKYEYWTKRWLRSYIWGVAEILNLDLTESHDRQLMASIFTKAVDLPTVQRSYAQYIVHGSKDHLIYLTESEVLDLMLGKKVQQIYGDQTFKIIEGEEGAYKFRDDFFFKENLGALYSLQTIIYEHAFNHAKAHDRIVEIGQMRNIQIKGQGITKESLEMALSEWDENVERDQQTGIFAIESLYHADQGITIHKVKRYYGEAYFPDIRYFLQPGNQVHHSVPKLIELYRSSASSPVNVVELKANNRTVAKVTEIDKYTVRAAPPEGFDFGLIENRKLYYETLLGYLHDRTIEIGTMVSLTDETNAEVLEKFLLGESNNYEVMSGVVGKELKFELGDLIGARRISGADYLREEDKVFSLEYSRRGREQKSVLTFKQMEDGLKGIRVIPKARVLIYGYGMISSQAALGLKKLGVEVIVSNRSANERAVDARDQGFVVVPLDTAGIEAYEREGFHLFRDNGGEVITALSYLGGRPGITTIDFTIEGLDGETEVVVDDKGIPILGDNGKVMTKLSSDSQQIGLKLVKVTNSFIHKREVFDKYQTKVLFLGGNDPDEVADGFVTETGALEAAGLTFKYFAGQKNLFCPSCNTHAQLALLTPLFTSEAIAQGGVSVDVYTIRRSADPGTPTSGVSADGFAKIEIGYHHADDVLAFFKQKFEGIDLTKKLKPAEVASIGSYEYTTDATTGPQTKFHIGRAVIRARKTNGDLLTAGEYQAMLEDDPRVALIEAEVFDPGKVFNALMNRIRRIHAYVVPTFVQQRVDGIGVMYLTPQESNVTPDIISTALIVNGLVGQDDIGVANREANGLLELSAIKRMFQLYLTDAEIKAAVKSPSASSPVVIQGPGDRVQGSESPSDKRRLSGEAERASISAKTEATSGDQKGGIDLNPGNMDLQTNYGAQRIQLPMPNIPLENIKIDGLVPIIIRVAPVTNLPLLLGLADENEADDAAEFQPRQSPADAPRRFKAREVEEIGLLN